MSYGDADGHDCPTTCPPPTIPEATPANVQKTLDGVQKASQAAEEGATVGEEVVEKGAGRLGLLAGPLIFIGEMIFPESVESGDVPARGFVPRVAAQPGQLGQARGAGEEHSQSDDAKDKTRTNGGLVKPATGKGSVPRDQRDPKRGATDKDKR